MGKVKEFFRNADKAMFGPVSPAAFGVFRFFTGLWASLVLLQMLANFTSFFTEQGLYPVEFATRWNGDVGRWNPLILTTDSRVAMAFFVVSILAAVLTCVGLFTRIASIVLFLGVVAIDHRNPDILNSGDTLLRMFCFYVAIGPGAAAYSLDLWLARKRGKADKYPATVSAWPQRLVQIQLAVVYFTTVWWKMLGEKWRNGTATWYPARLHEFDRFPYPEFVKDMPMVLITTYATLFVELALATLVFAKPFRKWVLLAGVGMHLWIDYSMNIPFFSWVIISGYVCFYEGDEVEAWFKKLGDSKLFGGLVDAVIAPSSPEGAYEEAV